MPFGKASKQEVQEIVTELFGMPVDDVKAKLSKIDSVETAVNDVKTLATGQTSVLEDIKNSVSKITSPYSGGGNPDNNNNNNNNNDTDDKNKPRYQTDWSIDADAAFLERAQNVIGPALLDTRSQLAKREAMEYINASAQLAKEKGISWQMLEKEIEDKSKDSPLTAKANPQFWKNVYYACLGEKYPEIERDRASKSGRFYTELASSSIVANPDDNLKPEDKLSQEQLSAAKKAGLSPKEFAESLNSMTVLGR